jgi:hypothetical protein
MNNTITAVITMSEALQSLVEAVQKLEEAVPPNQRGAFMEGLDRVRQKRAALQVWVEESRG